MGQLGAAVDANGHLRPESLLGVTPKLRILVHRQAQLRGVAPDPHAGGLRRGRGAKQLATCATTLGSASLAPQRRTPTLPGAPPSSNPANMERSSWSSASVFQTSGEGPWRSGGCLNHSTNAGCWQASPVTIQGRKCTPRTLLLARITSGATDEGRLLETSTIEPRTAACMGGGGAVLPP